MIWYQTLAASMFYILAGVFGLTRHFMLEPNLPEGGPKTPAWLLKVFFLFSAVMIFVGLRFLTVVLTGAAVTSPPGITSIGVVVAFSVFSYKLALLIDTVQRKPVFTLDDIVRGLLKAKGVK